MRPDPTRRSRLEVELSRWAAAHGGSVVQPCHGDLAGPHREAGTVVTLWPFVRGAPAPADPVAQGQSLAALHRALAGYPGPMPGPQEITGCSVRALERGAAASTIGLAQAAAAVREAGEVLLDLRAALDRLPPERLVPLHGDAHHGNAVVVGGRVTWWDLEDAWRGPVEWDVAVMALHPGMDGDAAASAYTAAAGVRPDLGLMALCRRLRGVQGRAWAVLARTELARP